MYYVGMDVSSKSFVVHAINEKKKVVYKGEVKPSQAGLWQMLLNVGKGKKQVIFEAGNQTKWIFDYLKEQEGVKVHVVHPNEVKWISESGGKKTDKVDAKKLAELARFGGLPRAVHMVEGKTRELRELLSARGQLQSKRVALINTLRGYVKQEGYKLPEKFFTRKDWQGVVKLMKVSKGLRVIIEQLMISIESLKECEARLTEEVIKIKDERIELAESVPGVGKIAARVVVSALDDVRRFDNKKGVAKYAALTPTVYQSGNETHYGRINRDGRQEVRKAMIQCAHVIMRMKSEEWKPLREFFARIEKRRGKKRAVVALSRKLLTTVYGVLKSKDFYELDKLYAWAA